MNVYYNILIHQYILPLLLCLPIKQHMFIYIYIHLREYDSYQKIVLYQKIISKWISVHIKTTSDKTYIFVPQNGILHIKDYIFISKIILGLQYQRICLHIKNHIFQATRVSFIYQNNNIQIKTIFKWPSACAADPGRIGF